MVDALTSMPGHYGQSGKKKPKAKGTKKNNKKMK